MTQIELSILQAIAEEALKNWDIDVTKIELVSISENVIYRIDTDNGPSYSLRIYRPGFHTFSQLMAELHWTDALSESGIEVPKTLMTRNGNGYATVPVPDSNETRQVGIVQWLEGVTLDSLMQQENNEDLRTGYFKQIGRLIARMHNQVDDWQMPDGFQRISWDADGFMGDSPHWGAFWELPELTDAQRMLILDARTMIHLRLLDYGTDPEHYGLIHADVHPENVIVHEGKVSIIDFDDTGFGWHIYDLTIALSYDQDADYFDTIRDAMIEGYRCERPLDDRTIALLPMFQVIRELILLGWLQMRPEYESSIPLSRRIERVCSMIEALYEARELELSHPKIRATHFRYL